MHNKTLTTLRLVSLIAPSQRLLGIMNRFGAAAVHLLCTLLHSFAEGNLCDDAAAAIAEGLKHNKTLTGLV